METVHKKRIDWIDTAKGIGIILVVLGHVNQNKNLQYFIYSFHMPLFFIISGYLYETKEKYIQKKAKRILIPYLIFSLCTYLYWFFIEKNIRVQIVSPLEQFINIFIARGGDQNYIFNVVMWFLPCLFITEIIFNFLYTKIKVKYKQFILLLIIMIFSILGFIYPNVASIRLPFCVDIVLTSIVFYYIGLLFRNKENYINNKIRKNTKTQLFLLIIFLIFTIILSNIEKGINLNNILYDSFTLLYITAILGFLVIYIISNKIKFKLLNYLGKESLYIMCLHEPIKRAELTIFSKIINVEVDALRQNILFSIINTIVIIGICVAIILVFKKVKERIK